MGIWLEQRLGQEASYEAPRDAAAVEYIVAVECTAVENTVVIVGCRRR